MARSRHTVLVLAERADPTADLVVHELNRRRTPVLRFDAADFPRHIRLSGEHRPHSAGWLGSLDDGRRQVRLADVRAVYYRRPGRPSISSQVEVRHRAWARDQADAALLNILSALPVTWVNSPHRDRLAAHKPQQLPAAVRSGLVVPATIVTNDPRAAQEFAARVGGRIVGKPVLGGAIDHSDGRGRHVPTHLVDPAELDDSVRLTAHLFQQWVDKAFEVRLVAAGERLFAASIHAGSLAAHVDWRTDYDALTYGTVDVPEQVAGGVRAYLQQYGLNFGVFDFAVRPDGQWVFFECNPSGQWQAVQVHTGLPIAAGVADLLHRAVR